ncbi:MAG: bifunctional diaminohydroxyphosphoribosylaminopyrimidine deaminase/5-amino-6-(5-phosphoribosylamino)uracil reductase RibD [Solirubrobacterales bacterium]|nr:bifunctional diaminohydroxyphosphoribosylaminopyrimidine deaminase/5-amino-6-(5-phosphoribosylamino)uracil reductase RibD [Solirubrobacterales bacterium]
MSALTSTDLEFLERALQLAERGRGRVTPNPLVGALVVLDGAVIGEGWHAELGGDHAEVAAIKAAGGHTATRGATMYVSLEPCCHQGRTPPCSDAITAAGIARVVIASDDPSEKANGRSLGILRDEGIEVAMAEGEVRHRAAAMNQPFRKHARTGRPWVLVKFAASLDGKVASSSGDSKWISGEESRKLVHQWRAEVDAVAVGIGTALADDPRLTARADDLQSKARRLIFDASARLPLDSLLVAEPDSPPLTVIVGRGAQRAEVDALEASGVDVIVATGENEAARVESALDQLGEVGITSLLLEGGPKLAGAFLDAGEVDELRIFLAPVLIGAHAARDPFEGRGSETIAEALRVPTPDVMRVGDDLLLTSRLREW